MTEFGAKAGWQMGLKIQKRNPCIWSYAVFPRVAFFAATIFMAIKLVHKNKLSKGPGASIDLLYIFQFLK